jgi:hypothetical protein
MAKSFPEIVREVDAEFAKAHPELKGRELAMDAADAKLREEWNQLLVKHTQQHKDEHKRILALAARMISQA